MNLKVLIRAAKVGILLTWRDNNAIYLKNIDYQLIRMLLVSQNGSCLHFIKKKRIGQPRTDAYDSHAQAIY